MMKKRLKKFAKEAMYLNSYISIIDNERVIIENCKTILECNDMLVRIITKEFEVEIWGSELSITNYATVSVEVCGTISSVSLQKRGVTR